jgi:predicted AAA+ superfamily ATPase
MINREQALRHLVDALGNNPVVALVGSRQSGKTTLAEEVGKYFEGKGAVHYFDLEDYSHRMRLQDPKIVLDGLKGLVIIDEVQHAPDLFMYLRVLADRKPLPARFLILGSASAALLKQSSESLAGRIYYLELPGFNLDEVGSEYLSKLWLRGGYPRSYLAVDEGHSFSWREQFIQTFLERDLPSLGVRLPVLQVWRFWQMAAHYHGRVLNHSEIGRSLGLHSQEIKKYLDVLTETFMVRQLAPWFENLGKRVVKSPKFYIRDTGLLHTLLGIQTYDALLSHPKLGASWEGFALEQILQATGQSKNAFFWAVHQSVELDLLLNLNGQRIGCEIKYAGVPQVSASMREATKRLQLHKLYVVYPGNESYMLDDAIEVLPLMHVYKVFGNPIKN